MKKGILACVMALVFITALPINSYAKDKSDYNPIGNEIIIASFVQNDEWRWSSTGGWWYSHSDGSYAKNGWEKIDGKWYYFNSRGYMQTGWIKVRNTWYYLQPNGAMAEDTWIGDYYVNERGEYIPGIKKPKWINQNGRYWYRHSDGSYTKNGWEKIDGKWYHFDANGWMQTGWLTLNGKKYYLKKDGSRIESTWFRGYYFGKNGQIDKSKTLGEWEDNAYGRKFRKNNGSYVKNKWYYVSGKKYYFDAAGYMVTGWKNLGGEKYYFYKLNDKYGGSYGAMATDTTIDGKYLDSEGRCSEVNAMAKRVLDKVGWDLKAAYNWSAGLTYERNTANASPGSEWFAKYGFENGKGNCYVMAATFYYMAKLLGYDAHQVTGMVGARNGGVTPHSWVEIDINGKTYVFDPDFTNEFKLNGYMITYGASGTLRYTSYSRMN